MKRLTLITAIVAMCFAFAAITACETETPASGDDDDGGSDAGADADARVNFTPDDDFDCSDAMSVIYEECGGTAGGYLKKNPAIVACETESGEYWMCVITCAETYGADDPINCDELVNCVDDCEVPTTTTTTTTSTTTTTTLPGTTTTTTVPTTTSTTTTTVSCDPEGISFEVYYTLEQYGGDYRVWFLDGLTCPNSMDGDSPEGRGVDLPTTPDDVGPQVGFTWVTAQQGSITVDVAYAGCSITVSMDGVPMLTGYPDRDPVTHECLQGDVTGNMYLVY